MTEIRPTGWEMHKFFRYAHGGARIIKNSANIHDIYLNARSVADNNSSEENHEGNQLWRYRVAMTAAHTALSEEYYMCNLFVPPLTPSRPLPFPDKSSWVSVQFLQNGRPFIPPIILQNVQHKKAVNAAHGMKDKFSATAFRAHVMTPCEIRQHREAES